MADSEDVKTNEASAFTENLTLHTSIGNAESLIFLKPANNNGLGFRIIANCK